MKAARSFYALTGMRRRPPVRVLSYGGGLDSFAMLLLTTLELHTPPDLVIFADVADPEGQDPGEWPSTYQHLRQVVKPFCAREGIEFKWLDTRESPIRGRRSLYDYFRLTHTMPTRQSRLCTSAAKVERIRDYVRDRWPGQRIEMWIGFEAGEEQRIARDPHALGTRDPLRLNRFPLAEHGYCRCRALSLVRRHGFAVPRKSACVFCPFGSRGDFQTLARELPERFLQTAMLEANCKTTRSGKILSYGYDKGDGSDPPLPEWIDAPYEARPRTCQVCGGRGLASKATGCDYLEAGGTP